MAATKRITKRQLKEDQFVTTAFHAADYFQEHRMQVLLTVGGVVAIILVGTLFARFQISSRNKAAAELSEGAGLFQTGNYPEAAFRLSTFLDSHPKHKGAGYAALLCADAYYYSARYGDAGGKYREALEKCEEGDRIWFAAKSGVAALQESDGKLVEAAQSYLDLASRSKEPETKAHLTYRAVQCLVDGQRFDEARDALGQLIEDDLDPMDIATLAWQKARIERGLGNGS